MAAHASNEAAEHVLDGVMEHIADGDAITAKEKRVMAELLAADIGAVADRLESGHPEAENTREALHKLMQDDEARQKLVEAAARHAAETFNGVCGDFVAAIAADPDHPREAWNNTGGNDPDTFTDLGHLLDALASWPGKDKSALPGLFGAAATLALAGITLPVTGGAVILAGAGVLVAEGVKAADTAAEKRHKGKAQSLEEQMRGQAKHAVVLALLAHDTNPSTLIRTLPTGRSFRDLLDPEGRLRIPDPGSPEWKRFEEWMEGDNPLGPAVECILADTDFGG